MIEEELSRRKSITMHSEVGVKQVDVVGLKKYVNPNGVGGTINVPALFSEGYFLYVFTINWTK